MKVSKQSIASALSSRLTCMREANDEINNQMDWLWEHRMNCCNSSSSSSSSSSSTSSSSSSSSSESGGCECREDNVIIFAGSVGDASIPRAWIRLYAIPFEDIEYDGQCEWLSDLIDTPSGIARFRYAYTNAKWTIIKEEVASSTSITHWLSSLQTPCIAYGQFPTPTPLAGGSEGYGLINPSYQPCYADYSRIHVDGDLGYGTSDEMTVDLFPVAEEDMLFEGSCEFHSIDGQFVYAFIYEQLDYGWTLYRRVSGVLQPICGRQFLLSVEPQTPLQQPGYMTGTVSRYPTNANIFANAFLTGFL